MSTKTFIACLALFLVVGSAIPQFIDNARGGQPILPGGRAAKIRSYSATLKHGEVIIPSVEGPNGFIITDIVAREEGSDFALFDLVQSGDIKATLSYSDYSEGSIFRFPVTYHFQSGIVLAPGEPVTVNITGGGSNVSLLVSGYTF